MLSQQLGSKSYYKHHAERVPIVYATGPGEDTERERTGRLEQGSPKRVTVTFKFSSYRGLYFIKLYSMTHPF